MRKAELIERAENGEVVGDGQEQIRCLCERAKFQTQWYAVRWKRLHDLVESADISKELKKSFSAVMANGTADSMEPPNYDHIIQRLRFALEAAEKSLRDAAEFLANVPEIPNNEGAATSVVMDLNKSANRAMLAR